MHSRRKGRCLSVADQFEALKKKVHTMQMNKKSIVACLVAFFTLTVWADSSANKVPPLPAYKAECSACHLAYPVGMLPAPAWKNIMGGLQKHYGTDASLDAATVMQIGKWLEANAGTYKRVSEVPPENRISKSAWFIRKHDEVSASVFKRASVGGAGNCVACHGGAAEGNFNEHQIRIPK